jgi:hypothetical protein
VAACSPAVILEMGCAIELSVAIARTQRRLCALCDTPAGIPVQDAASYFAVLVGAGRECPRLHSYAHVCAQ